MIGRKRVTIAPGLLALVMLYGLYGAGCKSASHFSPESMNRPADIDQDYGEYFDVIHVVVEGEQRRNERAGQVYRQVKGEKEVLWVRDLRLREVGFLFEGIAFKVKETVLPDGSSRFERTQLGDYGVQGGVQRLLQLEGGSVRLETVAARAKAP